MTLRQDFFFAIRSGDITSLSQLIKQNANLLNTSHSSGISPILFAAYHERPDTAIYLAEKKVMLDLFEAIAINALPRVIYHVTMHPQQVNSIYADGNTPLILAAYFGFAEICDYLLQRGAWVNQQAKNELKNTALHQAALRGHTAICQILLKRHAHPNIGNANNDTPLILAAKTQNTEIVRLLLFYGADMLLENEEGQTALSIAKQNGDNDTLDLLKQRITRRFKPASPP